VVAKVNGQIITLSEFQSRQIAAAQARASTRERRRLPPPEQRQDPPEAIDEILLLQKAEDAGIKAPRNGRRGDRRHPEGQQDHE